MQEKVRKVDRRLGGSGDRQPFDLKVSASCAESHSGFLRLKLLRAHQIMRPPLAELSVALVGGKRMSGLHQRFLGSAGLTDVLSFPLECDAGGRVTSGEVIVCVPEARRRAAQLGTRLRHELLLYALHGMLHLCGFDDRTEREYDRMHRMEDSILCRLGVGPVFRPRQRR